MDGLAKIQAVVRKSGSSRTRIGKGFSKKEMLMSGLTPKKLKDSSIRVDPRRKTAYVENVKVLEDFSKSLKEAKKESYPKLISPPLFEDFCNLAERAKNELYLISPFLSESSLKCILSRVKDGVQIKGIVRTKGAYSKALKAAKASGKELSLKPPRRKVHCKLLVNDNEAIISTANISKVGLETWNEVGILTNDPRMLEDIKSFFKCLWDRNSDYTESYYGKGCTLGLPLQMVFISSMQNLPVLYLDLLSRATEKVTIVTPYLTQEALGRLLKQVKNGVKVNAVIKVNENDWRQGTSDPWAINLLLERYKEVWEDSKLHAKILIVDNVHAIISSMNLTDEGLGSNFEAGVYTQNPELIRALQEFVEKLKTNKIDEGKFRRKFNRFLEDPSVEARIIRIGVHAPIEDESFEYPQHAGSNLNLPPPPKRLFKVVGKIRSTRKGESKKFRGPPMGTYKKKHPKKAKAPKKSQVLYREVNVKTGAKTVSRFVFYPRKNSNRQ